MEVSESLREKIRDGEVTEALPSQSALVSEYGVSRSTLLPAHLKAQDAEREAAGQRWVESGLVFPDEYGRSPSHRRDWAEWKALLVEANVRDGRLHDACHTAATVLLILGVPERAVMGLMGWSTTAMAARYQHMIDAVRADVASQVDGLIWKSNGEPPRE
nr:tyrosine-type recombinase/integrase [Streptomyces sp. SID9913]